MKALIDTNTVLDALASRKPFCADAERIFLLAADERFEGFVTANSITDIYYLLRKNTSEEVSRDALRNLLQLFTVVDITGHDCEAALDSPVGDYEYALIAICAVNAGVDCIVTRDEAFLQAGLATSIITPTAFLKSF